MTVVIDIMHTTVLFAVDLSSTESTYIYIYIYIYIYKYISTGSQENC